MRLVSLLRALGAGLLLAASTLAVAEGTCPPPAPTLDSLKPEQVRADVRDRGFLWRLTRDGRTSWLYGTVHVSRPDWLLPGPTVQSALSQSAVLALELDPADPELARVFAAPGDAARKERVLAGLRPRLAQLAARECVPPASIASLQPLLQLTMLSLFETRRDGFHPEFAVDVMLWGLAQHQGKNVVALETAASQLAALTPASEADERVLVTQGLAEMEGGGERDALLKLLNAWADSDIQALSTYQDWCQCTDTPAERRYLARLNDERNGPMADKLL